MGTQRTIQSFFTAKPAGVVVVARNPSEHVTPGTRGKDRVSRSPDNGGAVVDKAAARGADSGGGGGGGSEEALASGPPVAATATGRRTGRRVSALRAAASLAEDMDCESSGPPGSRAAGRKVRGRDEGAAGSAVAPADGSCGAETTKAYKRRKVASAPVPPPADDSIVAPRVQAAAPRPCQQHGSLNALPAEKIPRCELTVSLYGDVADRFCGRESGKFEFLGKGRRDGAGRRPTHPDYDPRTLFLPPEFLKGLAAGQRQWWEVKSKHMDKVLLFKMGKFYEMFEVDAHVGAQELDLQYMKGEQPHCGFPERNYSENVVKLAQKGYRVVVVEQTETPEQLEQRKKDTGTKDKVVRREICAIVTKGTMTDSTTSDTSYLLSITEMPEPDSSASMIGVCAVDTTTGRFLLSQFKDDETRSHLKSVLADLRPVEIVKPHNVLQQPTERVLRESTRDPLVNILIPGVEFWDANTCLHNLHSTYSSIWEERKSATQVAAVSSCDRLQALPDLLYRLVDAGEAGEAALSAFGGCCFYLKQALLDNHLLASGSFSLLPGSLVSDSASELSMNNMTLDSAVLESLEILENSMDHGTSGTMLSQLDHCVTSMGRRQLRQWLLRPLLAVEPIRQRQIAVADLKGVAAEAVQHFRTVLRGLPDMERLLAKMYRSRSSHVVNSQNVVVYEDKSKKEVQLFIKVLRSCQLVVECLSGFEGCTENLNSARLLHLLPPGTGIPCMTSVMEQLRTAFDWDEAEKSGRIMPNRGVNEEFDAANAKIEEVEAKFENYLQTVRQTLGCSSEISYTNVGKENYQIEIPARLHLKVPSNFEVRSSRKGFQRYWSPKIKELLAEMASAQEEREAAMSGILGSLICRFSEGREKWDVVLQGIAELDALISLSVASNNMEKPICTPVFISTASDNDTPVLKARALRHPTLEASKFGSGSFVPNDVELGGNVAPFMVLTGPNMGGKSTLLRQVSSAVIMAQVGADVPAQSFQLSPVDQIFVRMGASDHIMAGQSTFLVELLETASMLNCATTKSLVVLDEIGRGTSTADGQAIAHAVLQHLARKTGCRGLFSTHYHRLAFDHANDPLVGLYHMACKVGTRIGGPEEVTFLYKLMPGACPKSYGINVARLAGLPTSVLARSDECAAEAENVCAGEQGTCLPNADLVLKQTLGLIRRIYHGSNAHDMFMLSWKEARQLHRTAVRDVQSTVRP